MPENVKWVIDKGLRLKSLLACFPILQSLFYIFGSNTTPAKDSILCLALALVACLTGRSSCTAAHAFFFLFFLRLFQTASLFIRIIENTL